MYLHIKVFIIHSLRGNKGCRKFIQQDQNLFSINMCYVSVYVWTYIHLGYAQEKKSTTKYLNGYIWMDWLHWILFFIQTCICISWLCFAMRKYFSIPRKHNKTLLTKLQWDWPTPYPVPSQSCSQVLGWSKTAYGRTRTNFWSNPIHDT